MTPRIEKQNMSAHFSKEAFIGMCIYTFTPGMKRKKIIINLLVDVQITFVKFQQIKLIAANKSLLLELSADGSETPKIIGRK